MKGLILTGGNATRWKNVSKIINKHLLPVYDVPQVDNCIAKLKGIGIHDIGIVLGGSHAEQVKDYLGDEYTYIWQGEPKGIAQAVMVAKDFIGNDKVIVHLGDQYYESNLAKFKLDFDNPKEDVRILLKWDKHANRHSVVTVEGNKITKIVEKPESPEEGYVMVGVYGFSPKIFEILDKLKPSVRGEYELSDTVWLAIQKGLNIGFDILEGIWIDVGTPENLLRASMVENIINQKGG
jgi:glucose-1-phosphate thymidylyltransferase